MSRIPGLVDVISDLQIKNPQIRITIDRDRAAALGVDWNNISSMLYDAFGPQLVFHHLWHQQPVSGAARRCCRNTSGQEDSLKLLYLKSNTGATGSARMPSPI